MALTVVAGAIFLFEIKDILIALFIAFIIQASLFPAVNFLRARKIPKALAVVIVYFLALAVIGLLILPLLPFFVAQIQALFQNLPKYVGDASRTFGINLSIQQINSIANPSFSSIGANAFSLTGKVFGGLFSVLTIFIVSLYMLLDHDKIQKFPIYFFPRRMEKQVIETQKLIEEKLGAWLRGQVFLSFVIGFITWISLTVVGIEYALPLALLAGMLEVIPTLGPIIAAVPAVIVAFAVSPATAALVTVVYVIIQLAENNILVPKIMQKAVGLNPVAIIVAILIGGKVLGILGALLSIPFLSVLIIVYKQLRHLQ